MFWLAVCFASGLALARVVPDACGAYAATCAAAAALAIIFRRRRNYGSWLIAIAFIFAGAFTFQLQARSIRSERLKVLYDSGSLVSGTPVEVEGVLAGRPEVSVDGEFLSVRAETLRYRGEEWTVSGMVRAFVPYSGEGAAAVTDARSDISNLKYGSRVRIACAVEREDEYLNPGVQPKRDILDRQDIDATCTAKSRLLVEHIADESVFLPLAWVYDQRTALIDDFRNNLGRPAAGVMIASLLGDKYFLDKETADLFREGGTFHILVISGLHITFIGGLLLLLVRGMTRNRWIHFGVTASVLWAYTLAVGADVPVVRAAVMFTIVLIGYAIYRQGSLLNSLGICALVLLVWRPADLTNPSFQLTFVSVASIVLLAYPTLEHLRKIGEWTPTPSEPFPPNVSSRLRKLCEWLYWRENVWAIESKRNIWTGGIKKISGRRYGDVVQRFIRYVFEAVLVSLIVQISMLPLSVIYFHRVALSGVVLNLWVGLLIAVESFAAVVGAAASHLSGVLSVPLFRIADAANSLMLLLPRLFSRIEWSSFRIPAYSGAGALLYAFFFAGLILCAFMISELRPFSVKRTRFPQKRVALMTAAGMAVTITIIVTHPFSSPRADGRLHIDFLDVGQGDSALVTFPNGSTWLVDGGGTINFRAAEDGDEPFVPDTRGIGESVVSEVLWSKGYSSIDHIVATHADADHMQGLVDVANNFSIGSAYFGRVPSNDPEMNDLREALSHRGVPLEILGRGDRIEVGGAVVEVLYPMKAPDPDSPSDNEHSVVVRITFGSRAFLLTGDIERGAEASLVSSGGTLAADLVKVAHHGSRTSSTAEFIAAAHPQFAVISVGRRSRFGHPHPEVVERWRAAGAQVLTTGENGMISVSTDGKDLELSRYAH